MRFPYGFICRKNFFDKTETTDTTDTTIWKPGFKQTLGIAPTIDLPQVDSLIFLIIEP